MPPKLDPATIRRFETETEKAYAAGFFDGEGYTGIRFNYGHRGKPYATIHVSIGQNSLPVLTWLSEFYGGNIYQYKDKDQRQWSMNGTRAAIFLEDILPYLIVKKERVVETLGLYARRSEKIASPHLRTVQDG